MWIKCRLCKKKWKVFPQQQGCWVIQGPHLYLLHSKPANNVSKITSIIPKPECFGHFGGMPLLKYHLGLVVWPENIGFGSSWLLISRPSTWHFQAFNGNSSFPHLDALPSELGGKMGQKLGLGNSTPHRIGNQVSEMGSLSYKSSLRKFHQKWRKAGVLLFSELQEICLILWMAILMINSAGISICACISLHMYLHFYAYCWLHISFIQSCIDTYIYIYSFGLCGLLWLVLLGEIWLHFLHCPVA